MTYSNINEAFIKTFPEFKTSCHNYFEGDFSNINELKYPFYEGLVVHIIDILMYMDNSDKRSFLLTKLFHFIELMMSSNDTDVSTLAFIAFFEYRDELWFSKTLVFMSEELKALLNAEKINTSIEYSYSPFKEKKSIFQDPYKIRKDIWAYFKEDGLMLHEIPPIASPR